MNFLKILYYFWREEFRLTLKFYSFSWQNYRQPLNKFYEHLGQFWNDQLHVPSFNIGSLENQENCVI